MVGRPSLAAHFPMGTEARPTKIFRFLKRQQFVSYYFEKFEASANIKIVLSGTQRPKNRDPALCSG